MKTKKKYDNGGDVGQPRSKFETRQAKKVGRAQTRAAVAEIEGEGTVAQKRDNRASRVSTMAGTSRAKTPKSVSTSTSTSTSTTSTVNNNSNGNKRSGTGMTDSGPTKTTPATKTPSTKSPSGGPKPSTRGPIPKAKMGMSMKPTMMKSGGFPITEKAAARKEAKGKGRIGYKYGSNTDSPGTGNNKGSYVGFSREARKSDGPFKSMKDSKPARPIMKKGGTKKK